MENESILTQLVLEHSLRIRLKSDALDKEEYSTKEGMKKGTDRKDSDVSETLSTKGSANTGNEEVGRYAETGPDGGHAKEKTAHLIGKINNLIYCLLPMSLWATLAVE